MYSPVAAEPGALARPKTHIVALDGLRGVAALAVVLVHLALWTHWPLLQRAPLAVDFFFMLSGFVLGLAYEGKLRAGMTWRAYMVMRCERLYPLIALGAVAGLVAALAGSEPDSVFPAGAALIPAFVSAVSAIPLGFDGSPKLFALNLPEWSLFFELLASVAFGAVLFRLSTRTLLIAIGIIAVGYIRVMHWQGPFGGFLWDNAWDGLWRVALAFPMGLAIWRLYASGRAPAWRLPFTASSLILLGLFALPPLAHGDAALQLALVLVVFPALLIGTIGARPEGVSRRLAVVSGKVSYPLYILHLPVLAIALPALLGRGVPGWAASLIAVALAIVTAILADRLYDRPVRARLARWRAGDRPAIVAEGLSRP